MLENDLRKIGVELVGENHRNRGIDALTHFHLWHDQCRLARVIDADESVGLKLVRRIGGKRFGSSAAPHRKMEGEHESAG